MLQHMVNDVRAGRLQSSTRCTIMKQAKVSARTEAMVEANLWKLAFMATKSLFKP